MKKIITLCLLAFIGTTTLNAQTTGCFKTISAGVYHTIAIKTDGTLWAWGGNGDGQLGDGTYVDKNSPVQIGIATNWASISAGYAYTIATQTNGSLWAWGLNNNGQLGDGTTTQRNSPVQISSGGCVSCTPTTGTFTVSACNSYTWVAKGNKVYTASNNTDTIHLTNAGGCDSLVTLNLTIKPTSTSTTNVEICSGDSIMFNSVYYKVAGTYTSHFTNSVGCDSAASLVLSIKTVPAIDPVASQGVCANSLSNDVNFSSSGTSVTYNWTNNNTAIGLAASGTGNIAAFTGTNAGSVAINGTVQVTPSVQFGSSLTMPEFTEVKKYVITEHSGAALTGYQIALTINTQTLVAAGKMNADGSDIRFGYNNGTVILNHWIATGMNTTATVIYVNVDNIPASGTKAIYMYYGNTGVETTSALTGFTNGPNSATDSVVSSTINGNVAFTQRGFRFSPKEDIVVTSFGKRVPNATTRYVTLFKVSNQSKIQQLQVAGPAAQYSYGNLPTPILLQKDTQYILTVYQAAGDSYYYGSSTQIGQHLTYYANQGLKISKYH